MAMNRRNSILFILGIAATAFTGCAGDDELSGSSLPGADGAGGTTVVIANSDEEIRLGSGGNSGLLTRTFVDLEENNTFSTEAGIGVFCLAASKLSSDAPDIDWAQYRRGDMVSSQTPGRYMNWMGYDGDDSESNTTCWGGNVKANAVPQGTGTESPYTQLVWADGHTRFYPMSNWYAYTFYGYHPYRADTLNVYVKATSDSITARIVIDGYTDVLWGRTYRSASTTETDYATEAYSAKYFRDYRKAEANTGKEDPLPVMEFKHVLSRINFKAKRGDEGSGTLFIKDIVLLGDIYKEVTLRVADQSTVTNDEETSDNVGGNVWVSSKSPLIVDINIPGYSKNPREMSGIRVPYKVGWDEKNACNTMEWIRDDAERPNGVQLTDDGGLTDIGSVIVPPTSESDAFSLRLVFAYQNGDEVSEITPPFPYAITFPKGLSSGYQYNVEITVNTPEDVVINAELEPWNSDDEGNVKIEF